MTSTAGPGPTRRQRNLDTSEWCASYRSSTIRILAGGGDSEPGTASGGTDESRLAPRASGPIEVLPSHSVSSAAWLVRARPFTSSCAERAGFSWTCLYAPGSGARGSLAVFPADLPQDSPLQPPCRSSNSAVPTPTISEDSRNSRASEDSPIPMRNRKHTRSPALSANADDRIGRPPWNRFFRTHSPGESPSLPPRVAPPFLSVQSASSTRPAGVRVARPGISEQACQRSEGSRAPHGTAGPRSPAGRPGPPAFRSRRSDRPPSP